MEREKERANGVYGLRENQQIKNLKQIADRW